MATMLRKKICMVGSYGVGKTSLVRRFVDSIFDERYLTTIGVKIDKKEIAAEGHDLTLVIWDLAGEDEITKLRLSHLRGAAGYILVADGCRPSTLEKAEELHRRVRDTLGDVPFIFALNKADLLANRQVPASELDRLRALGWECYETSAKTADAVENLFQTLACKMLNQA
jgi:small GTP-binding protein